MKNKNMHFIAGIMMILPVMINGMYTVVAKRAFQSTIKKRAIVFSDRYSDYSQVEHGWYWNKISQAHTEFYEHINIPNFTTQSVESRIKNITEQKYALLDGKIIPGFVSTFNIMRHIVLKATEHKKAEGEYAQVLRLFANYRHPVHKEDIIIHAAVASNLKHIVHELLHQCSELVALRDGQGRIPLHYALSAEIAQNLIDCGSALDVSDVNKNTPLHLVPGEVVPVIRKYSVALHASNNEYVYTSKGNYFAMTPLRKAVYEGDLSKSKELLTDTIIAKKEAEIVKDIAELQFWRTNKEGYLVIPGLLRYANLLEE